MNEGSSRSHLVFAVKILRTDVVDRKTYQGKLSLVDLAGSESVGKTGADKQRWVHHCDSVVFAQSALLQVERSNVDQSKSFGAVECHQVRNSAVLKLTC